MGNAVVEQSKIKFCFGVIYGYNNMERVELKDCRFEIATGENYMTEWICFFLKNKR